MKKLLSLLLSFFLFLGISVNVFAENELKNGAVVQDLTPFDVESTSAILIEAGTGEILYSKNANEALPPASVTKVMTLLLIAEGIEKGKISLTDTVTVSEHAASMGGSQVFLKEGEKMSLEELLKCTVIASANDAAVALAEHLCGSESNFVSEMNRRALELGMKNTVFENVTGLDDTTLKHLTSAYDIAIMSSALIKYDFITKYSSLWQDSIRNGEFTLTNTNRLVRYYDGCNGLKTGSTAKAGYCISASAKRGDMQLIAVVMNASTRDERNKIARELLDYGFANYSIYHKSGELVERVPVYFGKQDDVEIYTDDFYALISKGSESKIEAIYEIPEYIVAPLKSGDVVGKVQYKIGDEIIGDSDIFVKEDIDRLGFFNICLKILKSIVGVS